MTPKKPNANKTWLPLIFVTVLNTGLSTVMANENEYRVPEELLGNVASTSSAPVTTTQTAMPAPMVTPDIGVDLQDLARRFPHYSTDTVLVVDTAAQPQTLRLVEHGQVTATWIISAATNGVGARKGSEQTPPGVHRVAQKIGDGAPLGTIFKARQNSGQIAQILTGAEQRSTADNVTTRILWLDGLEPGVNKGGNVDSYQRYIYIHGTDEEGRLGKPASHGCIRMRNQDVIDLFERVPENTLVVILPTAA